jgi:hypothetical protein
MTFKPFPDCYNPVVMFNVLLITVTGVALDLNQIPFSPRYEFRSWSKNRISILGQAPSSKYLTPITYMALAMLRIVCKPLCRLNKKQV